MNLKTITLFTLSCSLFPGPFNILHAAVPLKWYVETSHVSPVTFDAYQGETIGFEAALQSYGKPLAAPSDYAFYWQTNGMGSAWWVRPCSITQSSNPSIEQSEQTEPSNNSTNVLFATWTPDMDVGAKAYTCFIGQTGTIYHAAFQLRLRPSPGATPNVLDVPPRILDLASTVVVNPPWPTDETIDYRIRKVIEEDGIGGGGGGVDPQEVLSLVEGAVGGTNAVKAAVADLPGVKAAAESAVQPDSARVKSLYVGESYGDDQYTQNGTVFASSGLIVGGANAGDDFPGMVRIGAGSVEIGSEYMSMIGMSPVLKVGGVDVMREVGDAKAYARETYEYMTGNTNAWFAGTNYVVGADAETRHRFAWEDGMDAETVPCSMALWEIREGRRQVVWDQRDWTAWYWSFKAGQMRGEIAAAKAEVYEVVTNDETHAWAKRYAATGRRNPDDSTTFIDTQSVTLSPGMAWETVATVGGCGYWTIVGNGAVIGGSGTNSTLTVRDFEGNAILEVAKGQHLLAWLDSSDFVGQMTDSNGWVCFDMRADVQPNGYFSTTLESADFVSGESEDCPAQHRWESLGGGVWRVHFLLKPGIAARSCFAKFQVEVEGKTQIRYNADTVINGGLIFNGVKIAPVVTPGAAAGTSVEWKVVP